MQERTGGQRVCDVWLMIWTRRARKEKPEEGSTPSRRPEEEE